MGYVFTSARCGANRARNSQIAGLMRSMCAPLFEDDAIFSEAAEEPCEGNGCHTKNSLLHHIEICAVVAEISSSCEQLKSDVYSFLSHGIPVLCFLHVEVEFSQLADELTKRDVEICRYTKPHDDIIKNLSIFLKKNGRRVVA